MLESLRQFVPLPVGKTAVNYFGVPLGRFKARNWVMEKSHDGPLRMLYISEYSDYKNLTTLLKALHLLREKGVNDLLLTSTMDPSQFPKVEIITREIDRSLAAQPLVGSAVKFTGSIPYDEIHKLYADSDVFIFPSLAESFGHPLVEAMASGLPIIASDIPICHEICGDAAVYFSPLDPKDLADKIMVLKNSSDLRVQLGHIGRKRAETQFDWKDHVRRLVEIIDKVAANGSG
jgi:glycosyltransferase involved in cell wall biosynthesis